MLSGLPLLDLGLAVLRRVRKSVSPFSGDRQHVYDLLLTRGMSPGHVALTCCGVSTAFEVAGLLGARNSWAVALPVVSLIVVAFLTTAIRLGSLPANKGRDLTGLPTRQLPPPASVLNNTET
jgi:UDP-GlcNAc:undecaprenyl-phosphate GlcNAc-1-phosphate transferase